MKYCEIKAASRVPVGGYISLNSSSSNRRVQLGTGKWAVFCLASRADQIGRDWDQISISFQWLRIQLLISFDLASHHVCTTRGSAGLLLILLSAHIFEATKLMCKPKNTSIQTHLRVLSIYYQNCVYRLHKIRITRSLQSVIKF